MSDLLDRLKAGKSAIVKVSLNGVDFGLRVLNEQDYLDAGIAAEAAMKASGVEMSLSSADLFEAEKTSQLLVRALVDVSNGQPITADVKVLRSALSREESIALIEAYLAHEKSVSPSERNMSESDLLGVIEAVKKTPETTSLNGLSIATLKKLIIVLVSQRPN